MTSSIIVVWGQFIGVGAVIVAAGFYLARYGDVIADKTGLSGSWIGLALLATVTSLPELVTGISSVTIANEPDIAVGDVLGSCVFNLLILALVDAGYRRSVIFSAGGRGHLLTAAFGILLIAMAGVSLLLAQAGHMPAFGHIGLYAPAFLLFYVLAMRTVYRYERAQVAEFEVDSNSISKVKQGGDERATKTVHSVRLGVSDLLAGSCPLRSDSVVGGEANAVSPMKWNWNDQAARYPEITLRQAGTRFALAAVAVVAAGSALPFLAADLADLMGWSKSFVGTQFVAAVTSLPEVTVTIAALRMGAVNMAIANLLGSNMFNIAILAVDDAFYLPGLLLADVSPDHAVTALSAVAMSAVVVAGLLARPRTRIGGIMSWPSLALVAIYLLNSYAIY